VILRALFFLALIAILLLPEGAESIEMPNHLQGQALGADSLTIDWSDAPRATVIAFVSSRCPCSISHEKELTDLAARFSAQGIRFYGVHSNVDESSASDKGHFKKSELGFPIIEDRSAEWAKQFDAFKTPHVFVVAKDGSLLYSGAVSNKRFFPSSTRRYLREVLDDLVDGKAPRLERTVSIGCTIKRNL